MSDPLAWFCGFDVGLSERQMPDHLKHDADVDVEEWIDADTGMLCRSYALTRPIYREAVRGLQHVAEAIRKKEVNRQ